MISNVLGDSIGYIELLDYMGSDLSVVNAARVSFNKQSDEFTDKDSRLINYLSRHGHWSPFAHPQLSFRIKAPISVQRQWEKHKVGCVSNSESTRYVEMNPQFYAPKTFRKQGSAKQGSDGVFESDGYESIESALEMDAIYQDSWGAYKKLLRLGVAKEQARDLLPMGLYTTWIWTASLATCARVYKERTTDGAQWEIAQYAEGMAKLVEPLFPHSWEALIA